MFSAGFELGLCGFGRDRGIIPTLRLGVVSVWWRASSLLECIRAYHKALSAAHAAQRLASIDQGQLTKLKRLEEDAIQSMLTCLARDDREGVNRAQMAAAMYHRMQIELLA